MYTYGSYSIKNLFGKKFSSYIWTLEICIWAIDLENISKIDSNIDIIMIHCIYCKNCSTTKVK